MSQYSRYFTQIYSVSKITAISLTEEKAILTIDTLEGIPTETSLTLEQFYEMKPSVGKYLVVSGNECWSALDEYELKSLGKEVSLAEAIKLEDAKAA